MRFCLAYQLVSVRVVNPVMWSPQNTFRSVGRVSSDNMVTDPATSRPCHGEVLWVR